MALVLVAVASHPEVSAVAASASDALAVSMTRPFIERTAKATTDADKWLG